MDDIVKSALCDNTPEPWFSIITCSYNRAHTLPRCYNAIKSLKRPIDLKGEKVDFEWIIIDDGSSDGTRDIVHGWIRENKIPIKYLYQHNQGKHVASNKGISISSGFSVLEYDSDDIIMENALCVMYDTWFSLSPSQRAGLKGVTGRCIDSQTGKLLGTPLPYSPFIVSPQDMRFKHRIKGEMFGFTLRSIMLEHPYPVFDGATKFCPESIVIFEIGKKYKEAIVDECIRIYYTDSNDALTKGSSRNRAAQNYYLWKYEVNNLVGKYLLNSPVDMMKAVVGMSMDGFRTKRSFGSILRDIEHNAMKVLVILFTPVGYILSKR